MLTLIWYRLFRDGGVCVLGRASWRVRSDIAAVGRGKDSIRHTKKRDEWRIDHSSHFAVSHALEVHLVRVKSRSAGVGHVVYGFHVLLVKDEVEYFPVLLDAFGGD